AHRFYVGIVASEAESGLRLVDVGERARAGQIALQRCAIDGNLGAIAIDRAEQTAAQEVRGDLQAVHQRAYVAVTRLDRAAQLVILPLMTRKACLRALVRLRLHG